MSESIGAPKAKAIPIEKRFSGPRFKGEFRRLKDEAKSIEEQLWSAYRLIPKSEEALFDIVQRIRPRLVQLALESRALAKQYRKFNVGGVLLGLREADAYQNPWIVRFNANTKPRKSSIKYCAEQYLMDDIENPAMKIRKALSFVVVGEPQIDNDSNIDQVTLTPCKICRDRMLELSLRPNAIVTPRTEIYTAVANDVRFHKFQTVRDVHAFHGERFDRDAFDSED